jgi:hypothetical protein
MIDSLRQGVFITISNHLEEAKIKCQKYDDLKKSLGVKIESLLAEVSEMMITESHEEQ